MLISPAAVLTGCPEALPLLYGTAYSRFSAALCVRSILTFVAATLLAACAWTDYFLVPLGSQSWMLMLLSLAFSLASDILSRLGKAPFLNPHGESPPFAAVPLFQPPLL